ncbi:hypothetical protein CRE_05773 [Caenorhabditis remanei]|uniref:Protein amnionless n=2 Tax=Caenorhabditis remanei TaxID=31234 RepID=E3M001_CAERE|nr:hypothetical protein CRE_05773 [Caenorhabditis remanei]
MTTDDFNLLLRSMEGQFQINLARPWAKESDQGGVQRMIADDAITVKNKELAEDIRGIVNTNSNKKILSTICSYIACQDIQGQCVDFFKPFGHCCYVCGTQINFFASELHLDKSRAMVFNVLSEMEVTDTVFSTFERKTDDQLGSEYEIAVISSHNITFDEDFHKKARDEIVRRLLSISSNKFPTVSSMKLFSSKIDRTIRTLSKVVACLIYFSVVITLVGVYAYKNMELRVSRKNLFNPVIKYRRHQDDVAIEMEGGVEEETENVEPREEILENQKEEKTIENPEVIVKEEEKLENVEDWRNINPNFELTGSSDDVENQISYEMTETVKRENSDVDVKRESPDCTELIRETEKSYVAPFESIDTLETDYLTSFENPDVQEKDEEEKEVEKDMGSAVEEQNEDVANIFDINPNFEEEEDTSEPDSDIARDVELPQITVTSGTSSDVDPEAEPEKTVGKENKDVTESEEVELMDLL